MGKLLTQNTLDVQHDTGTQDSMQASTSLNLTVSCNSAFSKPGSCSGSDSEDNTENSDTCKSNSAKTASATQREPLSFGVDSIMSEKPKSRSRNEDQLDEEKRETNAQMPPCITSHSFSVDGILSRPPTNTKFSESSNISPLSPTGHEARWTAAFPWLSGSRLTSPPQSKSTTEFSVFV